MLGVADKETHGALIEAYHTSELAESTSAFLRRAVEEEHSAITALDLRQRAAADAGNSLEAKSAGGDILRRADGLKFLEQQRGEYCEAIRKDLLPVVSKARERVQRLAR